MEMFLGRQAGLNFMESIAAGHQQLCIPCHQTAVIASVTKTSAQDVWDCLQGKSSGLQQRLEQLTTAAPIMLFMKGNPEQPRCGFSARVVAAIREAGVPFQTFDILSDEAVRQGLKVGTRWLTIQAALHRQTLWQVNHLSRVKHSSQRGGRGVCWGGGGGGVQCHFSCFAQMMQSASVVCQPSASGALLQLRQVQALPEHFRDLELLHATASHA